ncbi:MAG TPA: glycoside hydrolase family 5 protein [Polyangiaceae bacterium]
MIDEAGAVVRLRGTALPNLIWDPAGGPTARGDLELMKAWGANVVRIGLNQGLWLDGKANCDAACYRGRVGEIVGWARSAGLDVILDLHFSTGNGAVEPQFMEMPDADSAEFWRQVAALYKNDGRVLFELYNEPHNVDWRTWRDGGSVNGVYDPDTSDTDYSTPGTLTYQATGMQALYDAVRATGAHNLVIAGGLDWTFTFSGAPEPALDGYNLAYAVHLYPYPSKLPDAWEAAFGFLKDRVPLIVSEFGPVATDGSCPSDYLDQVLGYADANALSWTAWSWFAGGTPSDGRGACTTEMFYAEADPANPAFSPTPYGARIRSELSSIESAR